jgi:hypothetical protein
MSKFSKANIIEKVRYICDYEIITFFAEAQNLFLKAWPKNEPWVSTPAFELVRKFYLMLISGIVCFSVGVASFTSGARYSVIV